MKWDSDLFKITNLKERVVMNEKIKKKKDPEKILEIIVAVFLGITALATAWASWIGSLHGGNQATNYATSNNLSSEGNSMYNEAAQSLMQDMMLWNEISDVLIESSYAEEKNDTEAVEKYDWKLEKLLNDNCSAELAQAITWAMEQDEDTSPFEKEGFTDSYFTDAKEMIAEADKLLEQGKKDNANGDAFGLVTVIYSVVLFLLGIVGTFKRLPNRYVILGVAIVGFLFATIFMFTIPMPTGFNILSYFGLA